MMSRQYPSIRAALGHIVAFVLLSISYPAQAAPMRLQPSQLATPPTSIPSCESVLILTEIDSIAHAAKQELNKSSEGGSEIGIWVRVAENRSAKDTNLYKILQISQRDKKELGSLLKQYFDSEKAQADKEGDAERKKLYATAEQVKSLSDSLPTYDKRPLSEAHAILAIRFVDMFLTAIKYISSNKLLEFKSYLDLPATPLSEQEEKDLRAKCDAWAKVNKPKPGGSTPTAIAGSASGMSWQGTLVTGLADFMVDRANQELVLWFVSAFKKKLCAESSALFPQTCTLLNATESSPASHGALLSSAIRADLEGMPIASFGYLYGLGGNISSLLHALRQRDVNRIADAVSHVIPNPAKAIETQCEDTKENPNGLWHTHKCQLVLAHRLLELVTAVMKSKPKNRGEFCNTVTTVLRDKTLQYIVDLTKPTVFSHLSEKMQKLLKPETPLSCAASPATPPELEQLVLTYDYINALARNPSADSVMQNTASLFRVTIDLLWPATVPTRELRMAIAATYTAEGLYSVFAGLRKGTPALELLAGLGTTLEKAYSTLDSQSLCAHAIDAASDQGMDAFCAIAATSVFASRFGGLVAAIQSSVHASGALTWNEETVCTALKQLGVSPADHIIIGRFFGGEDKIPSPLKEFFTNTQDVTCSSTPSNEKGYREVRALALAVFDLEQRIQKWRTGGPPPAAQVGAEMLSLVADLIESGATLVAVRDTPKLDALLSLMHASQDMLRGAYADGVRQVLVALAAVGETASLPDSVRKYITLLSDLAAAKDPKDVSAALSAAAAPVGSWRSKRQGTSLTVTGVVGVQLGGEVVAPGYSQPGLAGGFALGPMAALGLDLQFPVHHNRNWSWGFFATVLDVGQLAWARVSNTGQPANTMTNTQTRVNVASEVSFLSVLSPGLYLKFGADKTPLTFGVGASYAPQLRTYFYVDNQPMEHSDPFSMIRVGAFLAVDLNLFPIVVP